MLKTTQRTKKKPASLALHIRRLRKWAGEDGLSQADLAYVAGLCTRQLRAYECRHGLPRSLKALLQLALALKVPVELLLDEQLLTKLKAEVEKRRTMLPQRKRRSGRRG